MLTKKIIIDGLECKIYPGQSEKINYLLLPMSLGDKVFVELTQEYGDTWVTIAGMDWDNDLTPWPAPNVPTSEPPFEGLAANFLKTIEDGVVPAIETSYPCSRRALCGISLSGLFTLWAWMQTDTFHDMGSISGSFWYPGFVDWLSTHAVPKSGRAYFSLGVKEGAANGPQAFRHVQAQTQQVIACLKSKGIQCHFDATPGTHYSDPIPRLRLMAAYLK